MNINKLDKSYIIFGNKGNVWNNSCHAMQKGENLCGTPALSTNHARLNGVQEIGCKECLTILKTKERTIAFFKALIDKTNTYYLSDYVDDYSEFDSTIITKEKHMEIVKTRDLLKEECEKAGLDIHEISCQVGEEFMSNIRKS